MSKISPARVKADAKFFYEGTGKFWLRGATYGTFEPREESDYPPPEQVAEDFRLMSEAGVNVVRIYTAPPRYLPKGWRCIVQSVIAQARLLRCLGLLM